MKPVVAFERVSFAYAARGPRPGRTFAVEDVTFALSAGEVLGVIGPNSAGKTTLIRLLTRVLDATAGTIVVDGAPITRLPRHAVARRVAVVPQELPQGFPFTVGELVLMGRYPHDPGRFFERTEDHAIARAAMAATGVLDLEAVAIERLSGGERQRAVIARALAQRPSVMALDEPTAHLDLKHQAACAAIVRRLAQVDGTAVLLVSHDLNLAAQVCDRVLLLREGRVLAMGAPAEVLAPSTLEKAFDCPIAVASSPITGRPVVEIGWEQLVPDALRERR